MLCAKFGRISPVVLEKKIFKFRQCIFAISFLFPLAWKRAGPFYLNKLESPSPKDVYAKFVQNWPSGSWEEDENMKCLKTDGQQAIRKAHLSFQLRWAHKNREIDGECGKSWWTFSICFCVWRNIKIIMRTFRIFYLGGGVFLNFVFLQIISFSGF